MSETEPKVRIRAKRESAHSPHTTSPAPHTGIARYWAARDANLSQLDAARAADIAPSYASYLESQLRAEQGRTAFAVYESREWTRRDELHVKTLIKLGGYSRLSERLGPGGRAVICMPLIPFDGRGL